jgi:predicted AlkP superfamily pyrophosphatase or phosphodiesterase
MLKKTVLFFICIQGILFGAQAPKLTVIIVIDQFSYHYLPKLKPYLTGGLKLLINEGVNYTNTFYPHSMPGTCAGHTLLSTGTVGYYHGIVNNKWFNDQGKTIACDDDTIERAAVFGTQGGLYTYGKSARNILVDNLSDQLMLYSYPHAQNHVWSLSIKSRAAIPMAGKLGNALWLDDSTGNFTSSLAYFKKLPDWVIQFNKETPINKLTQFIWEPFYPQKNPAYKFADISNYKYSSLSESMLGKVLSINHQTKQGYDELYNKSPLANEHLINFAKACIEENYANKKSDRFILWLSLSSLDKVGHTYGPYSKEALDMIYHMDAQIGAFIKYLHTKADPKDTLLILTADHGIQPIPELLRDTGLSLAKRYLYPELMQQMNKLIYDKYAIETIVQNFKEPYFYLDQEKLSKLTKKEKDSIVRDLKKFLKKLPGIRNAWTSRELKHAQFDIFDLDIYLKRQLYKGRSGQIIYSVQPYTTIDTHPKGTSHITSFTYDTQVPLIFYQPGRFEHKTIVDNVYMTQVTPTLSQIFSVPRPSTAIDRVLPGLYEGE